MLFKVRRVLYEEIKGVETGPNFLNAAYLGYCLNVLGLVAGKERDHDEYPLRKAVISFAQKNYLALVERQHIVAAAVLVGTISFDKDKKQLVKTYYAGLNLVAPTVTLDLMEPKTAATSALTIGSRRATGIQNQCADTAPVGFAGPLGLTEKCRDRATALIEDIRCEKIRGCSYRGSNTSRDCGAAYGDAR